jgi:lipopolysaccharide transport system ATP-binding protein
MSDIVIKAENLGKKYIIGHQHQNGRGRYTTLRDVLAQNARSVWHKTRDLVQGKPLIHGDSFEEVWALKDVSFEVKRGEVIGIIGRNGAGKSTLLKILSRITEPSAGRVTIKGRVASLLEVGTGFHPELSGRENIFLNGAILGMTRAEIKKKFDEIVAFAEVEKFIDTPVKRYSSGMYVRLAFAVAAHLEPEILVVDEVLAVGDAEFQAKAVGKMDETSRSGRTLIFVSHDMAAITKLCPTSILLSSGEIIIQDETERVIRRYLDSQCRDIKFVQNNSHTKFEKSLVQIESFRIIDKSNYQENVLEHLEKYSFAITLSNRGSMQESLIIAIHIINHRGQTVLSIISNDDNVTIRFEDTILELLIVINCMYLNTGNYTVNIWIGNSFGDCLQRVEGVSRFEVINKLHKTHTKAQGLVKIPVVWQIKREIGGTLG